jgi:hypothetical protein
MRADSDQSYVLDLCDQVLGRKSLREHRFSFLVGDRGHCLPVDAYYPDLKVVVEFRERQHSEAVPIFDDKPTVSGMSRGQQRALYDQRRRNVLPRHGLRIVELDYSQFSCQARKKLQRNASDVEVIRKALGEVAT